MSPHGMNSPESVAPARSPEKKESFETIVINKLCEAGIEAVRQLKFRRNPEPESLAAKETLAYHNEEHTRIVVDRFLRIIAVLRSLGVDISEHSVGVGKIAASHHDTVQNFEEVSVADGERTKLMRQRAVGPNETTSAEQAIEAMRTYPNIFTAEDEEIVRSAIGATIPKWDPEHSTVFQPNLTPESSYIVRALALADLGAAGMDGAAQFLKEGDQNFREDNLDVADAIYAIRRGEALSDEDKNYFRNRMLAWTRIQPKFATGRKELVDRELGGLDERVREALKERLFSTFDESIAAAQERIAKREGMAFEALAQDMGYDLSPAV